MNFLEALESAPKLLVLYVLGLIAATVTDYTIITLAIASVLGGFVIGGVLPGLLIYFSGYFVLRLVQFSSNENSRAMGSLAQATFQAGRVQAPPQQPVEPQPMPGMLPIEDTPAE